MSEGFWEQLKKVQTEWGCRKPPWVDQQDFRSQVYIITSF